MRIKAALLLMVCAVASGSVFAPQSADRGDQRVVPRGLEK